jgi:DNA polymerase I-like protein with 3'-5' exonuclease and polymerase domains
MKPIVVDVETTSFMKGNPYSDKNKLCFVGHFDGNELATHPVDYGEEPYADVARELMERLFQYDLFVAFNAKFDFAWLRRYGINLQHCNIWDLQIIDFIIHGQTPPYPSLNVVCNKLNLDSKSDDLASKYWDQGIDTPDIPETELREYLAGDLKAEWGLFQWQLKYLKDKPLLKRLCWDACQDLLITQEMEHNGLFFDFELSKQLGDKLSERIREIDGHLSELVDAPVGNWNSNDWISAILYGGTCWLDIQEEFDFQYKDGRVATKRRKAKVPITFPRLVEPLKGTELKKQGYFEVNEGVLHKLKASGEARKLIQLILERNKIDKQVGTYFYGIPKLYGEMDWTNNIIHGQLNHCVAITGRLSSSKPNQQNLDPELKRCIKTRFQIINTKMVRETRAND